jgi:hypothetical protein
MSPNDDPIFEALASLPPIAPDSEWESCVRARCRSAISRRSTSRRRVGGKLFNGALAAISGAAALCAYLAIMFVEVVRLARHS